MRILRNICLGIVPVLIIVNLYRFVFFNTTYEFRGFSYAFQYISSFNGLNSTMDTINNIYNTTIEFTHIDIENIIDVFVLLGKVFEVLFYAFSLPLMIVYDVIMNIYWVLRMFMLP